MPTANFAYPITKIKVKIFIATTQGVGYYLAMMTNEMNETKTAKRFNFTYAIPGGAWLEFQNGDINWFSFDWIKRTFGESWLDRQMRKQGWMTGSWIDCA